MTRPAQHLRRRGAAFISIGVRGGLLRGGSFEHGILMMAMGAVSGTQPIVP